MIMIPSLITVLLATITLQVITHVEAFVVNVNASYYKDNHMHDDNINSIRIRDRNHDYYHHRLFVMPPDFKADKIADDQSVSSSLEELFVFNAATATDDDKKKEKKIKISRQMEMESVSSSFSIPSGALWRGAVVGLCALWASNFAAAKLVMSEPGVDSALYALSRFSLAALALVPGSIAAIRRGDINWETARAAAICGGWVAFGYLGQTLGLLTTTASKSCVICSLHCVFVAVLSEAMRVSRTVSNNVETSFDLSRLIPAAVAVLGVGIIELQGAGGAPTVGDALSFTQPIGFGLGYLQLENIMRENPKAGLPVSAIKLAVVSLVSLLFFEVSPMLLHDQPFSGFTIPDFTPIFQSPMALQGIAYTGLITTALALWVESIAFKQVPATDASIILTTEPLFAALTSALLLGENFGMSDYVGAALIIGACVLAILIDNDASDEQCNFVDAMEGKCEPPRTLPISKI